MWNIQLAAVQVHRDRDTSCLPTMETPLLENMGVSLILGYYAWVLLHYIKDTLNYIKLHMLLYIDIHVVSICSLFT